MTRRGSPEERAWRRRRNLEPGADGSQHGEQPVDPKGRHPREKPSGHRHTDPQPAKEHGSDTHDGTVADNPHGSAAHSEAYAADPHGNAAHSPGMVENPTASVPSLRRGTRAAQPTPSNAGVGSRYVLEDEANAEEVAADTTGDGTADSWVTVGTDPAHNHDPTYVNETGDTMSGRLTVDGPGTGYVLRDSNGTDLARIDQTADRGRFLAGNRDGTVSGSRIELHNSSHADANTTRVYGGPIELVGNALTDKITIDGPGTGLVLRDSNGTDLARIDQVTDRPRFVAGNRDGTVSGSRVELHNSSHANANATRLHGSPIEMRDGDVDVVDGNLSVSSGSTSLRTTSLTGSLTQDRGGIGEYRLNHTNDGTRNFVAETIVDDSGSEVTRTLFGSGDTGNPGERIENSVAAVDILFDGTSNDLPMIRVPTGSGNFLQIRTDDSAGSATGFDARTDDFGSGAARMTPIAGGENIAHFMLGPPHHIAPTGDGGTDLGKSSSAFGDLYYYNANNVSDPAAKRDMQPVPGESAARRVRDTAGAAIGFKWPDGQRTHLGFDADLVDQAHGDESAAFNDPNINGDQSQAPGSTEPRKSLRINELIPDLYVATADILRRLEEAGL